MSFAAYVAFITNFDLLFKPFGYQPRDNSILNIVLVLSGIFGSMICARYLDRDQPRYKFLYNICTGLGLLFMALFLVTLPSG